MNQENTINLNVFGEDMQSTFNLILMNQAYIISLLKKTEFKEEADKIMKHWIDSIKENHPESKDIELESPRDE